MSIDKRRGMCYNNTRLRTSNHSHSFISLKRHFFAGIYTKQTVGFCPMGFGAVCIPCAELTPDPVDVSGARMR